MRLTTRVQRLEARSRASRPDPLAWREVLDHATRARLRSHEREAARWLGRQLGSAPSGPAAVAAWARDRLAAAPPEVQAHLGQIRAIAASR